MRAEYFVANILKRYVAFLAVYLEETMPNPVKLSGSRFVWTYDTILANRPVYSTNDCILRDYSAYLNEKVTKDNYENFLKLDCDVKTWKIDTLSIDDAERIMKANIETVLYLEQCVRKAERLREIENERFLK